MSDLRETSLLFTIRRLGPGDELVLTFLAEHDADFDVPGRSKPRNPLSPEAAQDYLSNASVLHWVAFNGEDIIGFLYCIVLPMRADEERELLLYEIGVHQFWRRQGAGRLLIAEMERWMRENRIPEVWLGADNPAAEAFYQARGFEADPTHPIFMTLRLDIES